MTVSKEPNDSHAFVTRSDGARVPLVALADPSTGSESSPALGKVGHDMTGGGEGNKTVTTAGTPVQLASTTAAKIVTVQAYRANTGYIGVGFSNAVRASGTIGTGKGVSLAPGETLTLPIDDLADVWIDSTINGEGVRYTYET